MPAWANFAYLVIGATFVLALHDLARPAKARRGLWAGVAGAALSVPVLLSSDFPVGRLGPVIVAAVLGAALGAVAVRRPALVRSGEPLSLLTGCGGAAAALASIVLLADPDQGVGARIWAVVAILLGSMVASGSAVAVGGPGSPVGGSAAALRGGYVLPSLGLAALATSAWLVAEPASVPPASVVAGLLAVISAVLGLLLARRAGSTARPGLPLGLNLLAGASLAATGLLAGNLLLALAGVLTASVAALLTRSTGTGLDQPVGPVPFAGAGTARRAAGRRARTASARDVAAMLRDAQKVILVPGYGLALAQAQQQLRDLGDLLESRGAEVMYAIHPIAGRMPAHMNALLAEVDVPYGRLWELAEVNREFATADLVLVVGANDVVNPAARHDPTAPIYGMTILDVDKAARVVVLNRTLGPGCAGIDNELLFAPGTSVLLGDAGQSLAKVSAALQAA